MKVLPLTIHGPGCGYTRCSIEEATHILIEPPAPEPFDCNVLPLCKNGSHPCWNWNGDVEKPTLTPSILTSIDLPKGKKVSHFFVKDGMVEFLGDCTHEHAGKTLPLSDITKQDWFDVRSNSEE